MAQQTQADRAAAHWERFMARFPTVEALAAASPPTSCARGRASATTGGRSPCGGPRGSSSTSTAAASRPVEALEALPGVGPYTARAVAAIAFGVPVGAVDVNVRRVLGRFVGGAPTIPAADDAGRRRRRRRDRPARRRGPTP